MASKLKLTHVNVRLTLREARALVSRFTFEVLGRTQTSKQRGAHSRALKKIDAALVRRNQLAREE